MFLSGDVLSCAINTIASGVHAQSFFSHNVNKSVRCNSCSGLWSTNFWWLMIYPHGGFWSTAWWLLIYVYLRIFHLIVLARQNYKKDVWGKERTTANDDWFWKNCVSFLIFPCFLSRVQIWNCGAGKICWFVHYLCWAVYALPTKVGLGVDHNSS